MKNLVFVLAVLFILAAGAGAYYILSEREELPITDPYPEETVRKVEKNMRELDTQIRSELAQVRSSAESHYYREGTGTYYNFSQSESWNRIKDQIPDCSKQRLHQAGVSNPEKYQIVIEEGGYAQGYIVFAPLCAGDGWYCVDALGNAMEVSEMPRPDAGVLATLNCEIYR